MSWDLLIRGGTVVRTEGAVRADVAVAGGRIAAVGPALGTDAREIVDAAGLLVLPGVVDVHTHTRVASEAEPDRFFQDSVAAAFGGTTTFLCFNNPGTGVSEGGGASLLAGLAEFRDATANDSAVDFGLSAVVSSRQSDPLAEVPALVEGGVPTAKAFMVYDFGVDDRTLLAALRAMAAAGGILEIHCEDRALIEDAVERAYRGGDTLPRTHATTRTPDAEAVAVHRAAAFARAADAPMHVVHLSSAAALDELRRAKASGVDISAETCPHYLILTEAEYERPDADCACYVISPPLRSAADREALWGGLVDGTLDLVATDHVPDRAAIEKAAWPAGFRDLSNGAPGIETLLTLVYQGVAAGRITLPRMAELLAAAPARRFGLPAKGSIEVGKDADIVLFDPQARRTLRQPDLHHSSDYTPYEGLEVQGSARSVFVRGRPVVDDGVFVGQRGFGRFIERRLF
ncbi:MAG: dihydropyrimidinase [Chloroflexota bacterium]|nr:MAG: dihydropyrimidinase [Chloroflexota bacterium]